MTQIYTETRLDDNTYRILLAAGYKTPEIESCRVEWMNGGHTDEEWCSAMEALAEYLIEQNIEHGIPGPEAWV